MPHTFKEGDEIRLKGGGKAIVIRNRDWKPGSKFPELVMWHPDVTYKGWWIPEDAELV